MTVGPGASSSDVSVTGAASHIFSAAENGPRGRGGLTLEELRHISNGIWLCRNHATLVDTNNGDAFPAPLLLAYRSMHDAWVAREQAGTETDFGWIHSLRAIHSPVFRPGTVLHLGKVTLVHGKNSTGKSAIAEWLAGSAEARLLRRWCGKSAGASTIQLEVTYYTPEEHVVRLDLGSEGMSVFLDKSRFSQNPLPFRASVMSSPRRRREGVSDLEHIADHLGLDPLIVQDLLRESGRLGTGWVQAVVIAGDGDVTAAVGGRPSFPYRVLGGGSQVRLAIECAIAQAAQLCAFGPTVLVLDHGMGEVDVEGWQHYTDYLIGRQIRFQSVLVSHDRLDSLSWRGWEVAVLEGTPPDTQISQVGIHSDDVLASEMAF